MAIALLSIWDLSEVLLIFWALSQALLLFWVLFKALLFIWVQFLVSLLALFKALYVLLLALPTPSKLLPILYHFLPSFQMVPPSQSVSLQRPSVPWQAP